MDPVLNLEFFADAPAAPASDAQDAPAPQEADALESSDAKEEISPRKEVNPDLAESDPAEDDESTDAGWFPLDALPDIPERYRARIRRALEDRPDTVLVRDPEA